MNRKEKKQCHVCGADSGGKYHCETCRHEHNKNNNNRRADRKAAGLCPECGRKAEPNRRMCEPCQTKNRTKLRTRMLDRRKAGKCAIGSCYNSKLSDHRLCESCAEAARDYNKQRSASLSEQGLCASCGKEPHMSIYGDMRPDVMTRQCKICYLKLSSCGRFGSIKYWEILLNILEKQDYRCAYTGEKLILGVNDSIDHILPRSRYPDLTLDPSNIQWVTRVINTMKLNLLDCEFLTEIEKVARYLGENLLNRATSKTHPPPTRDSKLYHRMIQPTV
jgi:5-methylcytosine-specific restriction endonuclease McrA